MCRSGTVCWFGLMAAQGRGAARGLEMTEKKKLFRRVLEAIIEGRSRQAQRYVDAYTRGHNLHRPAKD